MQYALIIGGTQGMGRTFLKSFVQAEQRVFTIGRRKHPDFDFFGQKYITHIQADITEAEQLDRAITSIKQTVPQLNQIVFFQRYRGDDKWQGAIDVSLSATKTIIENLVPIFNPKHNNAIVLISSAADKFITSEQDVGYHVAKAGISQMTRFYAVKLGPQNIRVNAICSGAMIKEEARDYYNRHPELQSLYETITPLGRMGTAEDIAQVTQFLCSSAASFITGQCLAVDGGISIQWHESLARKLTFEQTHSSEK